MILLDENGEEVTQELPKAKKTMGSVVYKIGYHYCMKACSRLAKIGETPPEHPLLLREGSGKAMVERLKQYGAKEVVKRLNIYMDSDKFKKYPRLITALDADTYIGIERGTLK